MPEVNSYTPAEPFIPAAPPARLNLNDLVNITNADLPATRVFDSTIPGGNSATATLSPFAKAAADVAKDFQGINESEASAGTYGEAKRFVNSEDFQNIGVSFKRDNEDVYAQNQGNMQAIYNIGLKTLEEIPIYTGKTIGFIGALAGIGNNSKEAGGWIAGAADNAFSNYLDRIEKNTVEQNRPVFQEAADRNKNLFKRLYSDLSLWESIGNGYSFLESGGFFTKGLTGLRLGEKTVKGLEFLTGATKAADVDAALLNSSLAGAAETAVTPTAVMNPLLKGISNKALAEGVDLGVATVFNTASESVMEATQTGQELYNSLISKKDESGNPIYDVKTAKEITANAQRDTFKFNMVALSLSNLWEANLFYKRLPSVTKAVEDIENKSYNIFDDVNLAKKTFGARAVDLLKKPVTGVLAEGVWEENIQLAIQRLNQNPDSFDMDFSSKASKLVGNYLNQTINAFAGDDYEASENIFVGGLIGLGGGARESFDKNKAEKQVISALNSSVNNFQSSFDIMLRDEKGKIIVDSKGKAQIDKNKLVKYGLELNETLNTNQLIKGLEEKGLEPLAQIYKDKVFSKFAKAHFDAGLGEVLLDRLNNVANLNESDLQSLGFDSETPKAEIAAQIDQYKQKAVRFQRIYDNIKHNFVVGSNNDKISAIQDKLYYLATRNDSLGEQLKDTDVKIQNSYQSLVSSLYGENDVNNNVINTRNQLFENVQAAKRNVENQKNEDYLYSLYALEPSDAQAIVARTQKELEKYEEDNKETLESFKKDASGRTLYEVDAFNSLPEYKDLVRLQKQRSEFSLSKNATLNIFSKLGNNTTGEQFYNNFYQPSIDRAAREFAQQYADYFKEEPEPQKEDIYAANGTVAYSPNPVVQEKREKTGKVDEDLKTVIAQRDILEAKEDKTVEEEKELDDLNNKIDELQEEKNNLENEIVAEEKIDESENIKPADKEKYKAIVAQIEDTRKKVKSFDTYYEVDGERFSKVTDVLGDSVDEQRRQEVSVQAALNAGITIDTLVKAYFKDEHKNDEFVNSMASKISDPAFKAVVKSLDNIKKELKDKGVDILDSNVFVIDKEKRIVGEIDLLGVDKNGNFKIYEIQARRPDIYASYGKRGVGIKIREIDNKRLSIYRNMFANQYGEIPTEISVKFPFEVKYDKTVPTGFVEKAKLRDAIRFTPSDNVPIKSNLNGPIRVGSNFNSIDMTHLYLDTFLTDQNAKDKLKFLFNSKDVNFKGIANTAKLTVKPAGEQFQERFKKQAEALAGGTGYTITKFKDFRNKNEEGQPAEFDNLYSLAGNVEMSLDYEGTPIGYLSPVNTLAYKDIDGKFQVLDENTPQETYTAVTGNDPSTYPEFQKVARAYKKFHTELTTRLANAEGKEVVIDNKELQGIAQLSISYGELDLVRKGKNRPLLSELVFPGVTIGRKSVVTVVNVDSNDSIKVIMDKANKSRSALAKSHEIDTWANNHFDDIKAAITDRDGNRITDNVAIIQTPNGDYKIISLKTKEGETVDTDEDFITNLGDKFTASVSKDVFKNSSIMVIPIDNGVTTVDLKNRIVSKVYETDDVQTLEDNNYKASAADIQTAETKVEDFLKNLSEKDRQTLEDFDLNNKDAIMADFIQGQWDSIEEYIDNIKNCK